MTPIYYTHQTKYSDKSRYEEIQHQTKSKTRSNGHKHASMQSGSKHYYNWTWHLSFRKEGKYWFDLPVSAETHDSFSDPSTYHYDAQICRNKYNRPKQIARYIAREIARLVSSRSILFIRITWYKNAFLKQLFLAWSLQSNPIQSNPSFIFSSSFIFKRMRVSLTFSRIRACGSAR